MSLQNYYNEYAFLATSGQLCEGENCRGWLLSDVDTFHKCPCGKATEANHPEAGDHGDWEEMASQEGEAAPAPVTKAPSPHAFVVTFRPSEDEIPF